MNKKSFFTTYVKNKDELRVLNDLTLKKSCIDEAVFEAVGYSSKETILNLDETLRLADNLNNNIKKYFSLDIIPFNADLEKITSLLEKLSQEGFYGVRIQDLSVLNIIEENNLNLKVVLDTTTGGNNIEFYKFFARFNEIERIVLSRELSLKSIQDFIKKLGNKVEIQVYGLLQIFHTRRKLIDTIKNEKNIELNETLYLQEPKRKDEYFPFLQTDDGTFMFNSSLINLYDYKDIFMQNDTVMLIDIRHVKDVKNYEKVLKHFCNIEKSDLEFEKLPFYQPKKDDFEEYEPVFDKEIVKSDITEAGYVLDVVKKETITLKTELKLKNGDELLFYNSRKKELPYKIREFNKFGKNIYILPWRKGVIANSKFYIRNYEKS